MLLLFLSVIEFEVGYELEGLAALWRNEIFLCLGLTQCRLESPEVGRRPSVPDGEGKLLFLEAIGKTLSFLSVYKIIICKIRRHAMFSVFGADHSTCDLYLP